MKKLAAAFLALILILSLVSCGKGEDIPVPSRVSKPLSLSDALVSPTLPTAAFGNRGNSGSNIINGGFAMPYRGKLFFSDSSTGYKLASLDNSGLRILTEFTVSDINAFDNWLYFCNKDDSSRIYRCRTDGGELTTVTGVGARQVQAIGNWIYFSNLSDAGKLYKSSIDGNQLIKISDDTANDLFAYPETVFFSNSDDENSVYHISTDGSDRGRVIKHPAKSFNSYGVYLYYIDATDNLIYRSSLDGIYLKCLNKKAECINVSENNVYFTFSGGIYRMDYTGESCVKLADANTDRIAVMGSTIYYIEKDSGILHALCQKGDGLTDEPLSGTYYNIQ